MFKGKKGQSLVQQIAKRSNTFVPGESLPGPDKVAGPKTKAPIPGDRTRQETIEVGEMFMIAVDLISLCNVIGADLI